MTEIFGLPFIKDCYKITDKNTIITPIHENNLRLDNDYANMSFEDEEELEVFVQLDFVEKNDTKDEMVLADILEIIEKMQTITVEINSQTEETVFNKTSDLVLDLQKSFTSILYMYDKPVLSLIYPLPQEIVDGLIALIKN